MKTSMIGLVFVCVGSLSLASCATDTSTSTTNNTKKVGYKVKMGDAAMAARTPTGYTLIRKGGVEYYCHTETATGSHTQTKETCQTKEQIDAERDGTTNTSDYARGR
jgi:hypothetical protein